MKKFSIFVILLLLSVLLCACGEETAVITAYLDADLSAAEQRSVATAIMRIPDVEATVYVSAEEAWEQFLEAQENKEAFAGVEADDLRNRILITVSTSDLDALAEEISEIEGVEDVQLPLDPTFFAKIGALLQALLT